MKSQQTEANNSFRALSAEEILAVAGAATASGGHGSGTGGGTGGGGNGTGGGDGLGWLRHIIGVLLS